MPTSQEPELVIEDYLYNKFVTAAQAGGVLNAASQVNPGGSTGIQSIARVISPEQNVFPFVGVMFTNYENDIVGSHRDALVMHYDIVVAYLQPFSPGTADTAQQARLGLRNYVNDGSGNGMSPLLRSDRTLGSLAQATRIETLDYQILKPRGDTNAGTIATAYYRFEVKSMVSW